MWPRCLSVSPMTTKMLWKLNAVAQVILTALHVRLVDSGEQKKKGLPCRELVELQCKTWCTAQQKVHTFY